MPYHNVQCGSERECKRDQRRERSLCIEMTGKEFPKQRRYEQALGPFALSQFTK